MKETTIFHKILSGEIPSEKIHEDDSCVVIKDINPAAPHHYLCIPKKFIEDASALEGSDKEILGHLMVVCSEVAKKQGLCPNGFRLVINCGSDAGMEVPYLHIHILGGKRLQALG